MTGLLIFGRSPAVQGRASCAQFRFKTQPSGYHRSRGVPTSAAIAAHRLEARRVRVNEPATGERRPALNGGAAPEVTGTRP